MIKVGKGEGSMLAFIQVIGKQAGILGSTLRSTDSLAPSKADPAPCLGAA